jgi:hypothetical protein
MADEAKVFDMTVAFIDGEVITVSNACSYHLEDGFFSFINQAGGAGFYCSSDQVKYIRVNDTRP